MTGSELTDFRPRDSQDRRRRSGSRRFFSGSRPNRSRVRDASFCSVNSPRVMRDFFLLPSGGRAGTSRSAV